MTEISLFGTCSMTPRRFHGMAPHLQTEALRLMAESGYGVAAIEKIAATRRADLLEAYRKAHQVKIREEDRATPPKGPRISSMSATSRLILVLMRDQAGALASSINSLSYDLGKSTASVRHALQQLVGKQMIELTVPARGTRHPAQYRLTAAGEATASDLAACREADADA